MNNMKINFKKVGAIVLSGAVLATTATTILTNTPVLNDNHNFIQDTLLSAFEDNVENTVIADVDETQPMIIPQNNEIKYSMLGC